MKIGVDQTTAWLLAGFLGGGLFTGLYFGAKFLAKQNGGSDLAAIAHEAEHGKDEEHGNADEHATDAHHEAEPEHGKDEEHGHNQEEAHDIETKDEHATKAMDSTKEESKNKHDAKEEHSKVKEEEQQDVEAKTEKKGERKLSGAANSWAYSGRTGPEYWADLSAENINCQMGKEQSPVDLSAAVNSHELRPLKFSYEKTAMKLENDGRIILINAPRGSILRYEDEPYELQTIYFHLPSEHSISGIPFDMEIQLSHKSSDGRELIVAVFVEESNHANPTVQQLWEILPPTIGASKELSFNAEDLLPKARTYYQYRGSNTTPPCREGINWVLFKEPIRVSSAQIDRYVSIFRANARPVQGMGKRPLFLSVER